MIKQLFFLTTMDEEEINGMLERFPKLGERVRDWAKIGEKGENFLFHVITQDMPQVDRLLQRVECLGCSYKEIACKAKAENIICQNVIKRIVFTYWEVDEIAHRGNLGEWIAAGRPARLTPWYPAHVWFSQDIEVPTEGEVE